VNIEVKARKKGDQPKPKLAIIRSPALICPLLSGPISILELATKEEWNGEESQAVRDHRQAA
jgi:hypothetical protein